MKVIAEDIIKYLTEKIPELKYQLEKGKTLTIEPNDENGFSIKMVIDPTESMIFFGNSGHHIHCYETSENLNEYLNMIISSLTGTGRILAYVSDGKEIKWEYQEIDDNQNWRNISEMGTFSWKFWKKRAVTEKKILRNNYKINVC